MTDLAALVAEVKGELQRGLSIDTRWALAPKYLEWLGALVQAVEDQQRQLDGLDRSGWVGLLKCCSGPITKGGVRLHFDSCPDKCSAEVTRLRGEVAQLRADGQRLRQLIGPDGAPTNDAFDRAITAYERARLVYPKNTGECVEAALRAALAPLGDAP